MKWPTPMPNRVRKPRTAEQRHADAVAAGIRYVARCDEICAQRRERYATDPAYRERRLEEARRARARH